MPTFSWYAPTHGDGEIIGKNSRLGDFEYIGKIAEAADELQMKRILIPTGPSCGDPIVYAAYILQRVRRLSVLPAIRPGFIAPTVAAKMLANLDALGDGRVAVNVVAGGSPQELAMDGDVLDHDARYERAEEFLRIVKSCWRGGVFSYTGRHYAVRDVNIAARLIREDRIALCSGGASPGALALASVLSDTYLSWGEPVDEVGNMIRRVRAAFSAAGRAATFGMRINLIVESSSAAAWERADAMLSGATEEMRSRNAAYVADADSLALRRIQSWRDRKSDDPCFWTGMVPFRSGNSTALVGSVSQVAESLARYVNAGIEEFIFSSYPHLETLEMIGGELRRELARRVQ